MGPVSLIFTVFLLDLCQIEESRAVTPLFVQTGKDVLLELQTDVPKKFIALQWSFNGSANLVSFSSEGVEISDSFTGRVEVFDQSYSIKLKNLQKSDSAVYKALLITAEETSFITEHHVRVQDPVSPVTLTVNLLSNSSDSCNLTVSCSTQELHHINSTLTCDNKTCSQEGGERSKVTTSGSTLSIYLVNDTIICNHSNQVSWRKDNKTFENVCLQLSGHTSPPNSLVIVIVIILILSLIILGAVFAQRRKKTNERQIEENTVYAIPEMLASWSCLLHVLPASSMIQLIF
ncbi:uncharacterized protein LOC115057988 isoform X2 [Echeneis naucrates]|uniref:uncharacterized protein LOC115057988 isoform X2 n=1 Tax=Echeneis naucrates TaxID=173247 RepID=UPI0011145ACB|nr:uncharacterized protein LOC115057988 isoform X2 [Echeneis naucrates]